MHRFRKKSDAKRAQVPDTLSSSNSRSQHPTLPNQPNNTPDRLAALPPVSDFRTSLILPSLSRRFTLLQNSNGDPVSLDDMRARFAEQRARGAEHQISEEEEDMIVQALGELQAANVAASQPSTSPTRSNAAAAFSPGAASPFQTQQNLPVHHSTGGDLDYPTSIRSGTASFASSPSSLYPRSMQSSNSTSRTSGSPRYSSKRNSNNLFGSGRFHDTSYLHSISKASMGSGRSTTSLTGSDSHGGSVRSTHSSREAEGESSQVITTDAHSSSDLPTTPDTGSARAWPVSPHSTLSALPPRLSKDFTLQQARRTSLALEQVIRGIEEEAEETIMVPRTSVSKAGTLNSRAHSPKPSETPSTAGTPIPWMTDEARVDDRDEDEPAPTGGAHMSVISIPASPSPGPSPRPGTTSPTPRLPGYIPGMTRPLTPRDVDSDDGATGYSTTPRARSPAQPHHSHHSSNHSHSLSFSYSRHQPQSSVSSEGQSILPPSILRSSRGSTQMSPLRTTSPGLGNRSRGNSSSGASAPSPVPSPAPEERLKSDLLARRPLSPLIGGIVSNGYSGSRPATPSATGSWQPSSPLAQMHTAPPTPPNDNDSRQPDLGVHSTDGGFVGGDLAHNNSMKSGIIPGVGAWVHNQHPIQNRNGTMSTNGTVAVHRDTSVSSFDLGQSINSPRLSTVAAKIAARSPTPVHTHTRSPIVNDSGNGQDPILLNRTVGRRSQKRMRSPTPPPHIQPRRQTPPLALHTPSSSSNSSSNVNLNLYSNTSPLFSPMLNTSTSSLLSAGSSYHSWADENIKKSGWDQLVEYDSQRSAWQDILNSGGARVNEADDLSDTEALGGPEQVLRSVAGLTKDDLAAVQQKLVADALSRKGFDPPRSPTRRRRMSNSRGSFPSVQPGRESGTNSPAQFASLATSVTENGHMPPSPDSTSRANALLDSVLNSIQSQSATSITASPPTSSDNPSVEPLNSTDDDSSSKFPSVGSSSRESGEDDTSALRYKALAEALAETEKPARASTPDEPDPLISEPIQSPEEDSGEATEVPASQLWRSPPVPVPAPVTANHTVQLVRDVSRKAAEATAALKNPSQTKIGELEGTLRRKPTKRIDTQQISSPHFVSSSTSVNAIPITQNLSSQTSSPVSDPRSTLKLSQRLRKLRGTLRTKPPSRDSDEVTPFALTSLSDSSQPLRQLPAPATQVQTLTLAEYHDSPASATEFGGRFKVPVPSPPASAGPGLKGFMARFRKQRKDASKETGISSRDYSGYQSPDPSYPSSTFQERANSGVPVSPPSTARPRHSEDNYQANASRATSPAPDPATVNQLFDAASQLGLDRRALDALLARSTSTSSRNTTWTPNSTAASAGTRSKTTVSNPPIPRTREDHSIDRPPTPESHKPTARPNAVNRHPDGEIVRRTIIFASDSPSTSDLNNGTRKDSLSGGRPQRSPSATSIHSTGSATREPPVPRLPVGLGRTHSAKPSESSSYYDTFSQEQAYPSVQRGSAEGPSSLPLETPSTEEQGQGPALEVLHLSNGQVIWSVLDSLRAAAEEDTESLFRRSMTSSRGNDISDDMEVRFKEHKRWDSKGSNYSQGSHLSRRRQAGPSGPRPETKLFKTNSSTIGRLIEDLSKNMDSGSFDIMRAATGNPASFHSDTSGPSRQIERDLEALLSVINPQPAS